MEKTWYPVIDYLTCIECGNCVSMCPHGVYDHAKAPSPVVAHPQNCIDHCHGCGNKCPVGAITYVGDNTGWIPSNGEIQNAEEPCCSCGCGDTGEKKVTVEYLYLDLKTCDRCIGTDAVLDAVLTALIPTLELAGYKVNYKKVEMTTAKIAEDYQFLSSPTIRVNGRDICQTVKESSCGCCSDISSADVDCRVFEYAGEVYEVPPESMLAEAILQAVFEMPSGCSCGDYELPENLRNFFAGKGGATSCCCGRDCC